MIILDWWWEDQKQVNFSRLNFSSHSFNFYLWPGLGIHVFSILLPSSWGDPSHSSFCGLSASVRQFHGETAKWWNTKYIPGSSGTFVCQMCGMCRECFALNSFWLSSLLGLSFLLLTELAGKPLQSFVGFLCTSFSQSKSNKEVQFFEMTLSHSVLVLILSNRSLIQIYENILL